MIGAHHPRGSLCRRATATAQSSAKPCLKPATCRPTSAHRPVRGYNKTTRCYFLPLPLPFVADAAASFNFLASSFCFCLKAMSSCEGKRREGEKKKKRPIQGGVEQSGSANSPQTTTHLAGQHQRPPRLSEKSFSVPANVLTHTHQLPGMSEQPTTDKELTSRPQLPPPLSETVLTHDTTKPVPPKQAVMVENRPTGVAPIPARHVHQRGASLQASSASGAWPCHHLCRPSWSLTLARPQIEVRVQTGGAKRHGSFNTSANAQGGLAAGVRGVGRTEQRWPSSWNTIS